MATTPNILKREQYFEAPIDDVFAFFSDAHNLEEITPPFLNFEVLTPRPIDMHEGTLIDYRLKLRGIPIRWRTEILRWDPPHAFVDNQIRGPYVLWRHTHTFERRNGGTFMTDEVRYQVPGGPLAPLVNKLFVRRDVEKIFDYRYEVLEERFGRTPASLGIYAREPARAG